MSGASEVSTIPLTRPYFGEAESQNALAAMKSGWVAGQGPWGEVLEARVARRAGRRYGVAVNNCTAGLHLALAALGLKPGDEVLVADYTFPATAHAVLYCGAIPRFVDVRRDTGTIDPALVTDRISPKTVGIIGVDALGMPADWNQLEQLAAEAGLWLVEDAACSLGGSYEGNPCGSFGDAAVFSLHARKGITCGEGGIVVTDDEELVETIRSASNFGIVSAYRRQNLSAAISPEFADLGYNYKLSDILAAIAVAQLDRLDDLLEMRRALANRYAELLDPLPGVSAPSEPPDRMSTWQTYAVTLTSGIERDDLLVSLRRRGIGSTFGTYSLAQQPIYASSDRCPVSTSLFRRQVALPLFPALGAEEQHDVVETLSRLLPQHHSAI